MGTKTQTICWTWNRKKRPVLVGKRDGNRFGTVVLCKYYYSKEEYENMVYPDPLPFTIQYKAYFKGKLLGMYPDMNTAKRIIIQELDKVAK